MSCCGESRDKPIPEEGNRVTPFKEGQPVTQQPSAQSLPQWQEKAIFQPPNIATPPPAVQYAQQQNQLHQPWAQQPALPFNPYAASGSPPPATNVTSPTLFNASLKGYTASSSSPSPPPSSYGLIPPSAVYGANRMTVSGRGSAILSQKDFAAPSDEGKISVSIDFGTTFSGVAYGSSRIAAGKVQQILNWPGSFETFRKIPTCMLYDEHGQILAWGIEAKNATPMGGAIKCEWFKLFLEPHALRDEAAIDPRLPSLPTGKQALEVIVDFLHCLWSYAKEQITREIGAVADLDSADVWLTVPAAWDARGCQMMRDAAIAAELVHASRAGDTSWRERLRIITEPEAAAVHCAYLTDLHKLRPSQNFMICDAGGGTVDLAVYKIIGMLSNLEIAEMCARSGANCGSLFLDLRFRELVKTLLADHPVHLDAGSLAYFQHNFSEATKMVYRGEADDEKMFHFTCFNTEDPHDPSVGLSHGDLAIPGVLLRREVFDPVVHQVLDLIEEQTKKIDQPVHALLLVGGFSGSEYLFQRVKERFVSRIPVISRPSDCDTATLRGAAQYGLAGRALVSSVIAPQAYMMKVKLPAEPEDHLKRPAYIRTNDAGIPVCENRLQYLVAKGAILRKGQRIQHKFCKFSQNGQDRIFIATLYTSDSDKIMRYTDEGETLELCKWTVDLSVLPSYQENANLPHPNGFYTEFELGLELDSAEVRGVLIHAGEDWGRVVFDFRT
ncbi:actin-like ATPase domain-containing protein [Cytidiella melzeri]|nr:actin-like ATPase domain-containing protein [Cytidiella melzeri]